MENLSLTDRIKRSTKAFVLFHTYSVTKESVTRAIEEQKSMDLDVCVDERGKPYIGHSQEFYRISSEKQQECLSLWEAVDLIAKASIPIIIDCKHHDAWQVVEEVIRKIGSHRCLLHAYANELKFTYNFYDYDYPSEWSAIIKLAQLKKQFPSLTTTASCKFLPNDFLVSDKYQDDLFKIREILKTNHVDTVCLNVPDCTITNKTLDFFLDEGILQHINVDGVDVSKLLRPYVGETNILESASISQILGY
ncbi:MAG: hypothetical protein WCO78_04680 [Candidatus Roizmanbacteria bacterium]